MFVCTNDGFYILSQEENKYSIGMQKMYGEARDTNNLLQIVRENDILQLAIGIDNDEDRDFINETMKSLNISPTWTTTPFIPGANFAMVQHAEASKAAAILQISAKMNIPLSTALGVGDSPSDWSFMQECGYVACVGNAADELKVKVLERGKKGFIGGSVDDDGIIGITNWYEKQIQKLNIGEKTL